MLGLSQVPNYPRCQLDRNSSSTSLLALTQDIFCCIISSLLFLVVYLLCRLSWAGSRKWWFMTRVPKKQGICPKMVLCTFSWESWRAPSTKSPFSPVRHVWCWCWCKRKGERADFVYLKACFPLCVCVYALLFIVARTGALLSLHSLISRCHSWEQLDNNVALSQFPIS